MASEATDKGIRTDPRNMTKRAPDGLLNGQKVGSAKEVLLLGPYRKCMTQKHMP